MKRELLFALQQDRFDGRIVPVLHRSCHHDDLSWTLSQLQMVDFRGDFDAGCRELLRTWGIGYAPAPDRDRRAPSAKAPKREASA